MPERSTPGKFQRMAVERMSACEHVGELAEELGVVSRKGQPTILFFKSTSLFTESCTTPVHL